MLGITRQTVYRAIKRADKDGVTGVVTVLQDGTQCVTDFGYEYFSELYPPKERDSDNLIVNSLLEQLKEKDKQLAEKDLQINQLIEQAHNYQVLLKSEQDKVLLVAKEKTGFFSRLFSRKS